MQSSSVPSQPALAYRFLDKLGEGGMAEVYVGLADRAPGFRKLLVLKLLRTSLAEDPDGLAMFLDEARVAARLNHRNVVQTYEVGQVGDRHAIVMEFLEGATLGKLRRIAHTTGARRGMPLAESLHILCEALSGLHYAHELRDFDGASLQLVHRDFTPANIMVTCDGQVKVLDFGVAKTRANLAQTRTGTLKGTARYMAREAVLGGPIDRRSDVYMAGVVLWQLATGGRPWDDRADVGVLVAILEGRLPPIRALDPSLPEELEAIVTRATDPDADARYPTADALRDALLAFAKKHGLTSDSDRVGQLVRDMAGEECEALRRKLDARLSVPMPPLDLTQSVPALPAPSSSDSSSSRIRPSLHHEPTLFKLRRTPLILGAACALSVTIGLVAALNSPEEPPRARPADIRLTVALPSPAGAAPAERIVPAQAVPPAQEVEAPALEQVSLRLEVEPRSAVIYLDGKRLDQNPAVLEVPRDEALHEFRAEAEGHLSRLVQLRYERDAEHTLALREAPEEREERSSHSKRRAARRAERAEREAQEREAPSAPPVVREEPVARPAPRARGPRPREIDTENPFRKK